MTFLIVGSGAAIVGYFVGWVAVRRHETHYSQIENCVNEDASGWEKID